MITKTRAIGPHYLCINRICFTVKKRANSNLVKDYSSPDVYGLLK